MPKIIEITVGLTTSFNHPFEQYSNFKPSVTLKAILGDHEDPRRATEELQFEAGMILSRERHRILGGLRLEQELEDARQSVERWKRTVADYQKALAENPRHSLPLEESKLDPWVHGRMGERIEEAEANIDDAQRELAAAEAKLAALNASVGATT